ncbi:MAG: ComEC/Rec2 family competence protein [Phycisphaeraceae bacterium]|nr:MAG: ComEC/Rec2 family competence protein [Phycisphaeraceae bacterium]
MIEDRESIGESRVVVAARWRAWGSFAAFAAGVCLAQLASHNTRAIDEVLGDTAVSALLFGVAGLAAALILLLPGWGGRAAVLAAAGGLGAAVYWTRVCERPRDDLLRLLGPGAPGSPPVLVRVEGRVTGSTSLEAVRAGTLDEALARFDEPTAHFPMSLDTWIADGGPRAVSGRVTVYVSGIGGEIGPGRRVRLVGLLHRPLPAMNPGEGEPGAWAAQSGRVGWIGTNAGSIGVLEPRGKLDAAAGWWPRLMAAMHGTAAGRLDAGSSEVTPGREVLGAMLLGDRGPDGRQRAMFARTGVAHLLAISGFHLAVLVLLTVGVVRLTGDRPRTEAVVGLVFIVSYLAVVPARSPIVRAGLLVGSLLVAHFFSRRWDKLALLGWVAAVLLVVRPLDLFTLGYQLTVGVTALLLWINGARHPWIAGRPGRVDLEPGRSWRRAVWGWARSLVVGSVIVWLAVAPVIILHTGSFSPLAPIAVVVTTPIAVAVQAVGMAGLIAALFSPEVGSLLIHAAAVPAGLLAAVAAAFDAVPARVMLAPVSVAWMAAGVGVVMYALRRARLRDPRPGLALLVVVAWLMVEQSMAGRLGRGVAARVDMLCVGDGSCLLVRAGDDAVLWDAGSLRPGLGVTEIPRALRALGAPRVTRAVVTHANVDHYDALPDLARAMGLRIVYVSAPALGSMRAAGKGSPEALFLEKMRSLGVRVEPIARGDSLDMGWGRLGLIWPPADPPPTIRTDNDVSAVGRLGVPTLAGERHVLLTGDIGRAAMLMLGAEDTPISAEILELPHHGSHGEEAERFVGAVGPRVVLQSTGPGRLGDRRWNETRRAVKGGGGAWWITARDGASWAEVLETGDVRSGCVRGERREPD